MDISTLLYRSLFFRHMVILGFCVVLIVGGYFFMIVPINRAKTDEMMQSNLIRDDKTILAHKIEELINIPQLLDRQKRQLKKQPFLSTNACLFTINQLLQASNLTMIGMNKELLGIETKWHFKIQGSYADIEQFFYRLDKHILVEILSLSFKRENEQLILQLYLLTKEQGVD